MYYLTVSVDQVPRYNLTGSDSELSQLFIQVVKVRVGVTREGLSQTRLQSWQDLQFPESFYTEDFNSLVAVE